MSVLHFGSAKVTKFYEWSWQPEPPSGYYDFEPTRLKSRLSRLHSTGYGAHIHAIGDEAISRAINAIEFARQKGSYRDYGLTHLEMLAGRDISGFKRHNITADFQAGAEFFASHGWAVPYIGKARARRLLQMRKVFDAGVNVTFSSDCNVNDLNPLVAIANPLRHKKGQGLPNIQEALKAATINGAKALGLDKSTGSIKVGKSADFVVLSDDITCLSPNKIEQVKVLKTWLRGEVVYDAEG